MFKGENLINLRTMYGLSRRELSEVLAISEQAVWQYENGYTSPKLQTLNTLKTLFHVRAPYFYTEDVLSSHKLDDNINIMNIAYRSKTMHTISKTRAEAKYLAYLDGLMNEFTSYISHPFQDIINVRNWVIDYVNDTDDSRDVQIEHIAKVARESLGLSPATNEKLLFHVEKSGVFVFEKALGKEIDPYSLWTKQNRPYIILGNLNRSAVRRNFDIAHELGHLLLHYGIEFASLERKEHTLIEKEANIFAGAFLLPKDAFSTDMKMIKQLTNPDAYVDLKRKWNVSIQVLAYRAANLNLIEPKSHRNFYAALHRRGYLKIEPLDYDLFIQKPTKVKSMIDFLSSNELIDIKAMLAEEWRVDLSFLSRLTGIELPFLRKHLSNKQKLNKSVTDISTYL